MSKSLLLMMCLLTGLLVLACGKSAETNRNANTTAANSTTPAPAASVVTNKNTNSPGAEKIGIAECDAYLTSVDNCISTKVPEANRATFKQALNTSRTEWKRMADNPQTRGSLAAACKTALEHARTTYKAYNCTF